MIAVMMILIFAVYSHTHLLRWEVGDADDASLIQRQRNLQHSNAAFKVYSAVWLSIYNGHSAIWVSSGVYKYLSRLIFIYLFLWPSPAYSEANTNDFG